MRCYTFALRVALTLTVVCYKGRPMKLRARAEINSHFAAGPQARWRGASDELYPGRYVRSEQQSQRACGPQPEGARRRRARIGVVAAPRRCPTSPSSRRLASARPALAPKWEFISARALSLAHHKDTKTQKLTQTRTWWIFVSSCLLYYEA